MTIEETELPGIAVDFVEGMVVENGWVSPYMVRDQHRMETVFEHPHVLMTTRPISDPRDLLPTLDLVMKDPRPLVILAEKVDGGALGMLVANNQHRTIEAVAARAPGFGHRRIQHLGDLAAFTGGEVIADDAGLTLAGVRAEQLGTARRVVVTADSTTFVEGGGSAEAVQGRLAQIRAELARASQERDVEILQERLARLSSQARVDPGRRAVRGRAQGALPPHRGRARRDAGRGRRGHRGRRRHRAAAQRRARSTRSSSRATTRAAPRSCARCWPSRSTGSPATPATTARRRSTRCGRCRTATGSTRSPASSATCSRRASSIRRASRG